jgi:hypothetical protein
MPASVGHPQRTGIIITLRVHLVKQYLKGTTIAVRILRWLSLPIQRELLADVICQFVRLGGGGALKRLFSRGYSQVELACGGIGCCQRVENAGILTARQFQQVRALRASHGSSGRTFFV